jgi:hypothetical protein
MCYNRSWRSHLHRRKRTLPAPYHPCHGAQPYTCRKGTGVIPEPRDNCFPKKFPAVSTPSRSPFAPFPICCSLGLPPIPLCSVPQGVPTTPGDNRFPKKRARHTPGPSPTPGPEQENRKKQGPAHPRLDLLHRAIPRPLWPPRSEGAHPHSVTVSYCHSSTLGALPPQTGRRERLPRPPTEHGILANSSRMDWRIQKHKKSHRLTESAL